MFLTKTFALQDCQRFFVGDSTVSGFTAQNASVSYSSNGMKVTCSNWGDLIFDDVFTTDCEVSFDFNYSNTLYFTIKDSTDTTTLVSGRWDTQSSFIVDNVGTYNTSGNGTYKFKIQNGTLSIYKGDTLITSTTLSSNSFKWHYGYGGSRNFTIKNFKVKSL